MTRDAIIEDLIADASAELFSALCDGDGEHSEALDRGIIEAKLRAFRQSLAALAAPVAAEPLLHSAPLASAMLRCDACGSLSNVVQAGAPCANRCKGHYRVAAEPPSLVALVQEWQASELGYDAYEDDRDTIAAQSRRLTAAYDALLAWTPAQAEPRDRDAYIKRVRESTAALADRVGKAEVGPAQAEPAAPPFVVTGCEMRDPAVANTQRPSEPSGTALPASSPAAPEAQPEKP